MDSNNKKTARLVGILFIVGTVAGILSVVFTGSILNKQDLLVKVSENENQIVVGALCMLIMGFSLAFVPILMYPIFKKNHEVLALGYLVFRGGT